MALFFCLLAYCADHSMMALAADKISVAQQFASHGARSGGSGSDSSSNRRAFVPEILMIAHGKVTCRAFSWLTHTHLIFDYFSAVNDAVVGRWDSR